MASGPQHPLPGHTLAHHPHSPRLCAGSAQPECGGSTEDGASFAPSLTFAWHPSNSLCVRDPLNGDFHVLSGCFLITLVPPWALPGPHKASVTLPTPTSASLALLPPPWARWTGRLSLRARRIEETGGRGFMSQEEGGSVRAVHLVGPRGPCSLPSPLPGAWAPPGLLTQPVSIATESTRSEFPLLATSLP